MYDVDRWGIGGVIEQTDVHFKDKSHIHDYDIDALTRSSHRAQARLYEAA